MEIVLFKIGYWLINGYLDFLPSSTLQIMLQGSSIFIDAQVSTSLTVYI